MAQKRILIALDVTDLHSAAVAFALRRKGHDCEILYTPDFPTLLNLSLPVDPQDRAHQLLIRGPDMLREDQSQGFYVIWRGAASDWQLRTSLATQTGRLSQELQKLSVYTEYGFL